MQRIDENTYIDDTLVTCAEYQLFIDEMREQGKYYQPDHWISCQYPEGQALEPILGVRPSDALSFCNWLVQREVSEWLYRLPLEMEAAEYPTTPNTQTPLGYWVKGISDQSQFNWVGGIPNDAREITHALSTYYDNDCDQTHSTYRLLDINQALNRGRARALELTQTLSLAHDIDLDRTRARYLSRDLDLAIVINRARIHIIDRAHLRDLDRIRQRIFEFFEALGLNQEKYGLKIKADSLHRRVFDQDLARTLDINLDQALDLYVDIITLQERIAGRSPAFEGIRLVKERIR